MADTHESQPSEYQDIDPAGITRCVRPEQAARYIMVGEKLGRGLLGLSREVSRVSGRVVFSLRHALRPVRKLAR